MSGLHSLAVSGTLGLEFFKDVTVSACVPGIMCMFIDTDLGEWTQKEMEVSPGSTGLGLKGRGIRNVPPGWLPLETGKEGTGFRLVCFFFPWKLCSSQFRLLSQLSIHRLSGLNNKNLHLPVLEAGCLRSGCQHGQVLGEGLFLVSRQQLSGCVLTQQRTERSKLSAVFLIRALIPITMAPPS